MRFACEADRADSRALALTIQAGSCARPGELVFTATLAPDEEVSVPELLRDGAYSFSASATRGAQIVAEGCHEAELPSAIGIETVLIGAGCSLSPADDVQPELDAGTSDVSPADSGSPDSGPADTGATTDAHDAPDERDADAPSARDAATMSEVDADASPAISGRLFIAYTSSFRPSGDLTVDDGSVVRVGFRPGAATAHKLSETPAALVVLAASSFDTAAEIDAFALLPDGRYLLSTRDDAHFHGEAFDDDDLIAFEPVGQSVTRYMDLGSLLAPVAGSDVDVDALHVDEQGALYFSVEAPVRVGNATFAASDLLRLAEGGVERLVIGADAWAGRDLESLSVNPESGHFLASFAGSGALAGGSAFGQNDLVELAFGPGQPYRAGYRLFLSASAEFQAAAGTLSAVHFGE